MFVQVNYYRIAHKVASERGPPEILKKAPGLDVTRRIRLRIIRRCFGSFHMKAHDVFSKAFYKREGERASILKLKENIHFDPWPVACLHPPQSLYSHTETPKAYFHKCLYLALCHLF